MEKWKIGAKKSQLDEVNYGQVFLESVNARNVNLAIYSNGV